MPRANPIRLALKAVTTTPSLSNIIHSVNVAETTAAGIADGLHHSALLVMEIRAATAVDVHRLNRALEGVDAALATSVEQVAHVISEATSVLTGGAK